MVMDLNTVMYTFDKIHSSDQLKKGQQHLDRNDKNKKNLFTHISINVPNKHLANGKYINNFAA